MDIKKQVKYCVSYGLVIFIKKNNCQFRIFEIRRYGRSDGSVKYNI